MICRGGWSAGAIHKFRCVPHLTGRRFEHGVTDCYTLFRDAYHLAGIEMPDFHRGDDWWRHGQNLYLDNLEATGLYQVPLSAAQPGDVLCAVLVHRCRIMPPFTAATASCCTIFLNN